MKYLLLILSFNLHASPGFSHGDLVTIPNLLKRLSINQDTAKFYKCSNKTKFEVLEMEEQYLPTSCKYAYVIYKTDPSHPCKAIPNKIKLCEESMKRSK